MFSVGCVMSYSHIIILSAFDAAIKSYNRLFSACALKYVLFSKFFGIRMMVYGCVKAKKCVRAT